MTLWNKKSEKQMTNENHPNKKIILVVPCWNEEKRLRTDIFLKSLESNDQLHWLFVNDGSSDNTESLIREMVKQNPHRIFLHSMDSNKGKGEAVRQGLLKAIELKAFLTGYVDSDLGTPIDEILRLIGLFQSKRCKILLGARVFLLGRKIQRSFWRFLIGRSFALVASFILKLRVYDTQCGVKLILNFENLENCLKTPFVSRWIFDMELIQRLLKTGKLEVSDFFEEPLLRWNDVAGSKVKFSSLLKTSVDLLKIIVKGSK